MGLSLLFIITTLVYQRMSLSKTQAWKSSSLAVLRAISPQLQEELGGSAKPSTLNHQGGRTIVRLETADGDGWRLQPRPKDMH